MVLKSSTLSVQVQRDVIERYQRGERVVDIKGATGVTNIYSILRSEGLGPSRQRFRSADATSRDQARTAVLAALQASADAQGPETRRLSQADYNHWRASQPPGSAPALEGVRRFFGSWAQALDEIGLLPASGDPIDVPALARWLQTAAQQAGTNTLSAARYDQWRQHHCPQAWSGVRITNRVGWATALDHAGLDPIRPPVQPLDPQAIVDFLKEAAGKQTTLTKARYDQWRETQTRELPSAATISTQLGWMKTLTQAGINAGVHRRFSDEHIIAALQQASTDLDADLTQTNYTNWTQNRPGQPSTATVVRRIGWTHALHQAGLKARGSSIFSDEHIIAAVQQASADLGADLTQTNYRKWARNRPGQPSISTIRARVGWADALHQAGLKARGSSIFSDEQIIAAVQQASTDLGADLTQTNYRKWARNRPGQPSMTTVARRIGWTNALPLAQQL